LTDDRPLLRLEQAQEVVRSRDAIVFGLAKLTESRDPATGNHLERISAYVTVLARALRRHPKYQDIVTSTFVRRIGACSVLHDIGKVGITDSVLLKKGEFTAADKRIIQEHAMIGSQCLGEIDRRLGGSGFLKMAQQIAAAHHERWDGAGYPHGLAGEAIPLAARIVAIADVYDALVSKRIYKHSYTHEDCVEHICSGAGTQFDPQLIDVWLTVAGKFREIAERFQAHETGVPDALASEEIETIDDVLGFSGDLEHAGELAAVSGNNRHKLRLEGNEC
jgi:response regulator RpfG family c-di-GMP phosphodiesterase